MLESRTLSNCGKTNFGVGGRFLLISTGVVLVGDAVGD